MADPPSGRGRFRPPGYPSRNTSIPVVVACASGAAAVLIAVLARPFRIEVTGSSMEPSLLPGDYLVATKAGSIRRRALVVIERPGRSGFELVKRVVGISGDQVADRRLAPDEYWVLGDRGELSTDSRSFGPVGKTHIRGLVRLRYWPPRRITWFSARQARG